MTRIQIDRLRLENFKCHRNLVLDFDGQNVAIYGDNAAGKTSVYDALTWLLFGKDSAGNGEKNIEVKPLDAAGAVADHNAITAVEATLLVAGESVTLRRTYREVWSTKRGSSVETFDGHTSEYYIDGVPCKKNTFDSRIRDIVPEDTFRLLTSVSHFAQDLHWQKRRAVLFDIAGALTDREIMATDSRFSELSQTLGKLSLDDYRRKLAAERKQHTGVKTDIPARISECQKTIEDLQSIDYEGIKEQIRVLELEADQVAAQIGSTGADEGARLRSELAQLEQRIARDKAQQQAAERSAATHEQSIEESRARWIRVNQEAFTGGNCPTCGQSLPAYQLRAATDAFETRKRSRLQEIERTAATQKEAKEQAVSRANQLSAEIRQAEERAATLRNALSVAGPGPDNSDKKSRLAELRREISAKWETVGKRAALDRARQRIGELQQDARNAAECLESIEAMQHLVDEFTRYKTRFVEDSINGQFHAARFRLFREQANGGIEERCDVVFDGVPYMGLNNGAKINVGIDIINTLSRHYGVAVPLFVDNAESVTNLEYAATQVIRLVVSESDKNLRCEHES
ncbi:MAG: AAA family ATPase [Oscillospiraceae bacterium]|nr:AAA family ATPase [Oscillospiraceae bacterium]